MDKAVPGVSPAQLFQRVNSLIGSDLQAVDRLFAEELTSDLACVNTLVRHVSRFRGKMMRPCLVLLVAKALGDVKHPHVVVATVVEMVHMATLVHDDVLDEAELRRRGATINHLRGNEAAVLLGDFLISHSYHLCSSLQSQVASRRIGATTNQVCEGELLQLDNRLNWDLTEDVYLKIIARKTASLTAVCCELGARLSGADDAVVNRLARFGMCLGMAFQIQDDVLDIVGETGTVGKSLGSDVGKGKMTLPLIHFLKTAPAEHQALLRSLLSGADPDKAERIRNLILPSGSVEVAQARSQQLADEARQQLAALPPSAARDVLSDMATFAAGRAF